MFAYIRNRDAFYLLLLAVAGLVTGWWLLTTAVPGSQPPWTAVAALFIAALALAAHSPQAAPQTAVSPLPSPSIPVPLHLLAPLRPAALLRLLTFLISGLLLAYALITIPKLSPDDSYLLVTLAWLAAVAVWLTAVLPWQKPTISWQTVWGASRWQLAALLLLLLIALFLRVWRLSSIPFVLGGDEASQGLEAVRVLDGTLRNPLATGWLGVPTMSFFFNSSTIWLFGRTILGLRLPWALIGTANVLVAFLLVRRLMGSGLAWLTAVFLATYHYHIHFSRLGSNQIADPLFLSLALWLLYRALDGEQRRDWALVGLVTGFAFYFYAGARLTPVIVIAVLGYLFLQQPRTFWQRHQGGILVMVATFLFVAAPMLQYANRFPGEFNARINQVGIIQSGWLWREVEVRQQGIIPILWDQFQRAALAFNYYPDRTVWYRLSEPLLDPFFGALFLLGLLYGTLRLLQKAPGRQIAPMVAWWWGGVLLGGMLTESPPSSQRLITLAVPACFLVALALWQLVQLTQDALGSVPVPWVLAVGAVAFASYSLTTYFVEYTPQRLYGGHHAELATELAPQLNELKSDHRFYFVGAPWMYWSFATLPYLVPGAEAMNVGERPETAPISPAVVAGGRGAVYIFLPERLDELPLVQQAFPHGTVSELLSPVNGRLLATLYTVPPSSP